MRFLWERLADDLRTELGELGGLVRLLELRPGQEPEPPEKIEAHLSTQAAAVHSCREHREKIMAPFLSTDEFFRPTLLSKKIWEEVAPEARPLILALSEEVERLDEQFYALARTLPVATQEKLSHIMGPPYRPAKMSGSQQRAEGSFLPVHGGH